MQRNNSAQSNPNRKSTIRNSKMFQRFMDWRNRPKNRFSIEYLNYCHQLLLKNPVINEQNKAVIIETLRQIAELMIWGDQHNPEFFDFFLEKQLLAYFLSILDQKTNSQVKVQLLQTLSILIENIRAKNSIYFLLSNNHINDLIVHKFDFSDDEILAYYISLLKTLSLKLNEETVQFFFNEQTNDFPLYNEAIKFFNHRDSMIRIAVRTITLTVYKVEYPAMRRYILDKTAAPYFSNLVWYLRDQCHTLDRLAIEATHSSKSSLEDYVAELLDNFFYLQDIFNLKILELSNVLADFLLHYLLIPQIVGSLMNDPAASPAVQLLSKKKSDFVNNTKNPSTADSKAAQVMAVNVDLFSDRLSPLMSLFLLSQFFYVFSYKPLVNAVAAVLVLDDASEHLNACWKNGSLTSASDSPSQHGSSKEEVPEASDKTSAEANPATEEENTTNETKEAKEAKESTEKEELDTSNDHEEENALVPEGNKRLSIVEIMKYTPKLKCSPQYKIALKMLFQGDREALVTLCLFHTMLKSPAIDHSLLESAGLLPFKVSKAKQLMSSLQESNGKGHGHLHGHARIESDSSLETRKSISMDTENDESSSLTFEKIRIRQRQTIADMVLRVLLFSADYRIVTTQMSCLFLKELLYDHDALEILTSQHKVLAREAYIRANATLKDRIENSGNLKDVSLEIFEQELKRFRQINPDRLMMDYIAMLLPVSSQAVSGVHLTKRQPSGPAEEIQKSVQDFLILREFLFTFLRLKDDHLPLKEKFPTVQAKDVITINVRKACMCYVLVGPSKKRLKRFLLIDAETKISLLLVEPATTNAKVTNHTAVDTLTNNISRSRSHSNPNSNQPQSTSKPSEPEQATADSTATTTTTTNNTDGNDDNTSAPDLSHEQKDTQDYDDDYDSEEDSKKAKPEETEANTGGSNRPSLEKKLWRESASDKPSNIAGSNVFLNCSVCTVVPVQALEVFCDNDDDCLLHIVNHATKWNQTFMFDSHAELFRTQEQILRAKTNARKSKMVQIMDMLNEDNPSQKS